MKCHMEREEDQGAPGDGQHQAPDLLGKLRHQIKAAAWANTWSAFARSQAGQLANTSAFWLSGTTKENDFCHQHSPYHRIIAQFSMINGFHLGEAENETVRRSDDSAGGVLSCN